MNGEAFANAMANRKVWATATGPGGGISRLKALLGERAKYDDARSKLLETLTKGATGSPLKGPLYTHGMAGLREALGQQAEGDARSAAARGLAGGEFELAQLNNRTQNLVGGQRALVGQAYGDQRARQALLETLIGRKKDEDLRRYAIDKGHDAQQDASRNSLIGSLFGAGLGFFAGGPPGAVAGEEVGKKLF